jgi:hypothetical protein
LSVTCLNRRPEDRFRRVCDLLAAENRRCRRSLPSEDFEVGWQELAGGELASVESSGKRGLSGLRKGKVSEEKIVEKGEKVKVPEMGSPGERLRGVERQEEETDWR